MIISDITCDFRLPAIAIKKQFFFIVKEFLVGLSGIFKIGSLDYGVDGTSLLAISAKNTFSEIDVVTCGSPSTITAHFRLDCDSLCRACRLAKFASDAPLFARRVSA